MPKGVTVELPFRSFSLISQPGAAVFSHTLVVLEEGAEAFVVDAFRSPSQDGQSFASAVVELIVGQDAKLRYVQVQDWGRHVWNFMTERAILGQDATLNSLHVTLGSKFTQDLDRLAPARRRTRWPRCSASSSPTATSSSTTTPGSSTSRRMRTSDLEFKGALKDNARSVYSGLIKVSEGAQKTDAYQQNRNLVLSRTARADSIPNLEIGANDVRCTHGATVSQVEEEHLFYLQARGIPRTEAQKLIVEGFFRPVIDRIPVEEIQGFLERRSRARLVSRRSIAFAQLGDGSPVDRTVRPRSSALDGIRPWLTTAPVTQSIGRESGRISRSSRPANRARAAAGVPRQRGQLAEAGR